MTERKGCGPEGFSFLFNTAPQTTVCVEAPSLKAISSEHTDLTEDNLSEVWCHGCANRLWPDPCDDSRPWQDAWTENEGAPPTVTRHPPHISED